ncbi:hypothetical protein E2542_SST21152 [Spatholobus suberectus]|nr:hypothetical protein E2542_SST21152 [Spatholobus suberectus]
MTKFGDIIDCIDIYKQLAFDHPLLKSHKLQRKPSFQKSNEKTSMKNLPARPIFGLGKDQCPIGTVPIQRITKDDLIRGKSLLNNHIMTQGIPGHHFAEVHLLSFYGPYYGVNGKNSIYSPRVERKDQITASHLWVQNGPIDANNNIMVGWHVAPQLYGDDGTYFYSSWSDKFKKTGCYNMLCPGFVQTHKGYYLGARIDNTSIYGGTMIEVAISISQDRVTKNWWLNIGNENIGYYPTTLFSNMTSADQVGWGGRTSTPPDTPSPQMGSGYFPDDNFVHACYFRFVSFQNASRQDYGPKDYQAETFTDRPDCFGVEYYGNQGREVGYSLQFGGPGGNCGN